MNLANVKGFPPKVVMLNTRKILKRYTVPANMVFWKLYNRDQKNRFLAQYNQELDTAIAEIEGDNFVLR